MTRAASTTRNERSTRARSGARAKREGGVTITTVAAAAGVSSATVSRVLAGVSSVHPELAERVRRAAHELDYRPNDAARVLATGRHHTIGVVIPDAVNPYFLDVVKAILVNARKQGYRVLVGDSENDPDEELAIATDLTSHVDGIALISSRIDVAGLRSLVRERIPVVLVNRIELGVELPMVAVDNFSAMLEICSHLASLGHRQVVYVGGEPLAWQNRERWRAVQQARVFGLEPVAVEGDGTIEAGRDAAEKALQLNPTALVCFNDLMAVGAISRLRELGIRVPDDLSVTGFDDLDVARYAGTSLTTAVSPKAELGERVWTRLQASLDGDPRLDVEVIPTRVVLGASTGPAHAAAHTGGR